MEPGSDAGTRESIKILQEAVNKFKKGGEYDDMFPDRWLPATFVVLPEAFDQENGLLNTTMKMVRGKICTYFEKELKFLYSSLARNIENDVNLTAIKEWNKKG